MKGGREPALAHNSCAIPHQLPSAGLTFTAERISMIQLYKKYSNTLLVYAVYLAIIAFAVFCGMHVM